MKPNLIIKVLILSLLFALPAEAGPLDFFKHPIRTIKEHPTATAFVVGTGAAVLHGFGLEHCRQGSVENCQAKYGAAWFSFGAVTVANFTTIAVSDSCRKNGGGKFCNVLAYGGSAGQAGFGISQWKNKGKPHEKADFLLRSH